MNPLFGLAVACGVIFLWCILVSLRTGPSRLSSSRLLRKLSSFGASDTALESVPTSAQPILRELVATERAYLQDLRCLCACHEAFPQLALGHAVALRILHQEMASLMGIEEDSSSQQMPSLSQVARAFTRLAPFLRTYAEFVSGQYERMEAVGAIRSKSLGAQRLDQWRLQQGHPVESLLIKPVQVSAGAPCLPDRVLPIIGPRYTIPGANYDLCEAEYLKLREEEQQRFRRVEPSRFYRRRGDGNGASVPVRLDLPPSA